MEVLKFSDIPLLAFGNEITTKGMIMEGRNGENYLVLFPMEKVADVVNPKIVLPSSEEWYALQDQLDRCNVMGTDRNAGILLRKTQRVLDQKICWQVYQRDKFKCRYCAIDNVPLTVDHIITWESGGATHEDNLLTCCRKCNKKRGNLPYGLWLMHSYYTEKSKHLTEAERKANEDIVSRMSNIPRLAVQRSR